MTDKADRFLDFEEHDGLAPPYARDDRVDVQFADGRVEMDAKASYWMNRGGLELGMWDGNYDPGHHRIIRRRLASNPLHPDGLEGHAEKVAAIDRMLAGGQR